MGRRAELRGWSDAEVRAWMAPRRAAWRIAVENNGIDGGVGAIVRAHNAFAGGGVVLLGRAKYNKRAAVGTHQHEPIVVGDVPAGGRVVGVEADPALPPLPATLPADATYVLGHDALGLSPALAARCDARYGPPPGWSGATSPSMLAHLLMWRLRGLAVGAGPRGIAASPGPAWQEDWPALTRAEQRARLGFAWWVGRFAWAVRRDWWVCLPDGQTPLNAVAAARNALAAGAAGLVTREDPGRERAPLGDHWRVRDFAAVRAWAREEGRPLLALEQDGTPLAGAVLPARAVLVAGHEVRGLSPTHLRACEERLTLPQWGSVNSLNVASAIGLALDLAPSS
ncbi:MAG: TrmH family methyltransferase [Solirubrobacterales bacterium]|nr:TrmH family methyltransferase [Solirubrobacterales bacterium]